MPPPTSRNQPTRRALLGLALAATCGLPACAVGTDAQTNQVYTAAEGADVRDGDVEGLNLLVVDNGDGTGTLVAALVNNADEDDSLEQVAASDPDGGGEISVTGIDAPIELPAGDLVQLADLEPVVVLSGDPIAAGQVIRIDLAFTRAGAISTDIPVVLRDETYQDVPTPAPTGD